MDTIEEIRNIKALLDQGAIDESEFQIRKKEILSKGNIEIKSVENMKNQNSQVNVSTINEVVTKEIAQTSSAQKILDTSYIDHASIISAGSCLRKGVRAQVFASIFNFIGIFILVYSFIKSTSKIMSGGKLENELFYAAGIFFLLGFLCWIISLSNYDNAGLTLKFSIRNFKSKK